MDLLILRMLAGRILIWRWLLLGSKRGGGGWEGKNCFFLFCFDEEENMIGFEDVELVVGREGGNNKFFANLF